MKNKKATGEEIDASTTNGDEGNKTLYETDSIYRGIIVACQRSKQLIKGALPRTSPEFSHKRKSTRIAVEEVRQGLIGFEIIPEEAA